MKNAKIEQLFSGSPQVLTIPETARLVRASESFLKEQIHRDRLPCYMVGTHFRVLKADVLRFFSGAVAMDEAPGE